jgi:hypothetical protein
MGRLSEYDDTERKVTAPESPAPEPKSKVKWEWVYSCGGSEFVLRSQAEAEIARLEAHLQTWRQEATGLRESLSLESADANEGEARVVELENRILELEGIEEDLRDQVAHLGAQVADLDGAAKLWNEELAAEFPPSPDGCPLPVFVARQLKAGASYDGESGLWWTSEDKPGIMRTLEAKVAELEAELADTGRVLGQVIAAGTLAPGEDFAEPLDHAAAQSARSVAADRNRLRADLAVLGPIARAAVKVRRLRRQWTESVDGDHLMSIEFPDAINEFDRRVDALTADARERLMKEED